MYTRAILNIVTREAVRIEFSADPRAVFSANKVRLRAPQGSYQLNSLSASTLAAAVELSKL
ncbi:hypothetical protein PENNAL_c0124G07674 [Penicillium nalgiovense]|uniref:Uncharacterized protein n=1 Tax=Penicillium nalgiovense TaxID=60175 RepID=A0A1V6X4I5_PENNA|nr:hypothetical protein PENNAL_c0124G07674 [Penicillium nalgiovense]